MTTHSKQHASRSNSTATPTAENATSRCGRFLIDQRLTCQATKAPAVLAYFKSRWGEVDGYLPVLHKFKEMHPDWRIIAVIGSERMANTVGEQTFLYNELKDTADILIRPAPKSPSTAKRIFYRKWIRKATSWYHRKCVRFSWRKIFKFLEDEEIKVIIKDNGHDDEFLLQVQANFPAICVSAPHGTGIFIEPTEVNFRKKQQIKIDLFLAGDESEIPCFQKFLGSPESVNMQVIGRPRYDQWWIEHLAQLQCFTTSQEYQLAKKSQRVFLFATRGPSTTYFPTESFEYLIRTVAETVLSEPGNLLLIKPHPQQDLEFIKSTMAQYPTNSWRISTLQTMQLAKISNFAICMHSSVILDALAIGKPTVEYFQFTRRQNEFFIDEKGKTISAYAKLGLLVPADNKEDLQRLIVDYFDSENRSTHWQEQRIHTAKFLKLDNNASHRAVTEIEKLLS
jgi:hypothetical protein